MRVATLLYYAVVVFLLGSIALALNAPDAITRSVSMNVLGSPWLAVLLVVTLAVPVLFIFLAFAAPRRHDDE